ncbi:GH36-type glycosyl hydrolase domain-containing protein [Mahella australiensis]|uniref:Cellobiose phosphorylase n=1 Tax=Mahella australiensis (strain DSM 15567 / CIP 107919 / 50-1 BON) TaxID=697281 RepID=F4A373_MAHA5|nr:glycosyl transferase [Mahella australiensis]AEE96306.1 cellobiose phosphorylase [Mahella australiensis 50-1 BON]
MRYGYFDNASKEYIITDPKLPVKWINYVGGLYFGGFVDHTGGSLICKGDPAINRIVKYIPQLPDSDFKGETLYIRIKENDGYKFFSPFYVPTLDNYDLYECHVGLGYSRIISEFYGIRADITIYVPHKSDRVIRDIKIRNLRNKPVDIDVIPVVEYTHFDALKQFDNNDWVPQTMQSKAVYEENGLITITQFAFMRKNSSVNYFTSNNSVSSFETDRRLFLGNNGYGTWACPISLYNDELSSYEALRGDNICALMHHLGQMDPGGEKRVITQLGQCENVKEEKKIIDYYRNEENVDKAFSDLKSFWDKYLSTLHVETPDEDFNTMVNIHNPRQCYITKNWSRYLSLYQMGLGSRGMGFRDSSQDVLGILGNMPEEGCELIEKLLQVQKIDGSAMHQFNPVTMIADEGDARERQDRPKYYGDDHLWIVLAVSTYLKETGDIDFLDLNIPFYDKNKDGLPLENGTVMEHLQRAIEFTHDNIGQHGLALLGFADWNDTVNLPAGAESVFNANLYGYALLEMMDIARYLNEVELARKYQNYHETMKNAFNDACWDGEWYIRYFDKDGNALGSKNNDKCKIYVNAQSWPVISRFAPADRAKKSLGAVYKYLNTSKGIKLSAPGYNGYNPDIGGITTYPPGAKENGGIFLHANIWAIIAETIVGNGDRAYEYYNQINPVTKNNNIDEFECEPYVYPQNILGDEHPQFGLARNSWLSGTASWAYQAATRYILGILPSLEGLILDPCIPAQWNGFRVTRKFRNAIYIIEVANTAHMSKGIKTLIVDGKKIRGNIIPIYDDGNEHIVRAIM